MKHQQILDKLAAAKLVEAITDDVATLLSWEMLGPGKKNDFDNVVQTVLPQLLTRWNCVLQADDEETTVPYRQKTVLALATVLHKYGMCDAGITAGALAAIDSLNLAVALSDDFFRKSEAIKTFLLTAPKPLSRRPGKAESLTFLRAGDVISIRQEGRYYAAYVHDVGQNTAPVVELYDLVSDHRPAFDDLASGRAQGARFNDGSVRVERYQVNGLKSIPDPANQFHLLASGVAAGPSTSHLGPPVGLYSVTHLFGFLRAVGRVFQATA